ncbi:MAG: helix-turn-helix transcriptional regulator [Bacteroidota bacterium]
MTFDTAGYKEKEFGFQLVKMEDVFSFAPTKSKNPFISHRINFFTVLILTEGEMVHEVDFVKCKMTKGDCLFITKGQIHKFDESSQYKGYGIIFTEEFMLHHMSPSAYSKINFLYSHNLSISRFKDFDGRDIIINALKYELSIDHGSIKSDIAASFLTVLLLKVQLNTKNTSGFDEDDYSRFLQFQELVESKYMFTRATKAYANLSGISYKQLNTICMKYAQKTAKDYISHYIVLEAKRQLATTNHQVKQIAYDCGFKEATNFVKFFKKVAGTTPLEFRNTRI